MHSPELPPAPTADDTLRHLRQFSGVLFLANPCSARRSRCVFLAPGASALLDVAADAAAVALLEREYAAEVRAYPSFVTPAAYAELKRDANWLPSDSYICHGSTSQGSGRSVFQGKHQLKGVGRTLHVGHHDFFRDLTGALSLREAVTEAALERRLRDVLTTPPIPIDFVLVPEQGSHALLLDEPAVDAEPPPLDIRCIMGRRGSPLRIGHLDYLAAALRTVNEATVGSYLVHLLLNHVGGVPKEGIEPKLLDTFDQLMHRAIRLSAESLVYSLRFSYWPDNFDLFSRVVDVAETTFLFPALLHDEDTSAARPGEHESPRRYLTRLSFSIERLRSHALYPIRNMLSAMHLIAHEVRMPSTHLDERYSWEWLRDAHKQHVTVAVAKVLGIAEATLGDSATLRDALAPIVDRFPLLPDAASSLADDFSWEAFLADFEVGAPLGVEARAAADPARGAAFRQLLSATERDRVVAECMEHLERAIIKPYLESGLDALPDDAHAIPHLGA